MPRFFSAPFTFCAAALICSWPLAVRADFVEGGPTITATPGMSGEFEISYNVPTGATTSTLTSFNLTLSSMAAVATGLTFTAVTDLTTDPYVFANSTTFQGTVSQVSPPDAMFSDSGNHAVTAGQTFGLAEISYSVATTATPGAYTLDPTGTVMQSGSVMTVNSPGEILIVPEPRSDCFIAVAAAALWLSATRIRRGNAL